MATRKWIKKEKPERIEFWVDDVRYAIIRCEYDDNDELCYFTYFDGSDISIDNKAKDIENLKTEVEKKAAELLENRIDVLQGILSAAQLKLRALNYALGNTDVEDALDVTNKESKGFTINAPCKLGDKIFFDHLGECEEGVVMNVNYDAEKDRFVISGKSLNGETIYSFTEKEIFFSENDVKALIESRREKPSHRIGTKVYWQTCSYEIKRGAIKEYQYDGYTIRYIILVEDKTGYEYTMKPEDANKVFFYKKKDLLNKIK